MRLDLGSSAEGEYTSAGVKYAFISYVRENQKDVDDLCTALRAAGINVWLDREQIEPGTPWKKAIRNAIQRGSWFIAFFSRESLARPRSHVNEELALAVEELRLRQRGQPWFISVLLSVSEPPQLDIGYGETLADLQWVDLTRDREAGIQKLVNALKRDSPETDLAVETPDVASDPGAVAASTPARPLPLKAPPPFAATYARRILEFGVWFAIGLSPFLGKVKIPGFSAIIEMYPSDLQQWLVPVSGLFMGMMAVTIEFASGALISARTLTRWFIATVATFALALVLLLTFYQNDVARLQQAVRDADGDLTHVTRAIVTGTRTMKNVPTDCKCKKDQAAADCIAGTGLNPESIHTCFPGANSATQRLALVYLAVTGSFAAAVGLLMLDQRRRRLHELVPR